MHYLSRWQSDKDSACQLRKCTDTGSVPGSKGCSGVGNGNPLQYSCLENSMHRGAWRATVQGVARVGHDWVTKPPTSKGQMIVKDIPSFMTYCFIPFIHDVNPHTLYKRCSLNTRYSTFTSLSCFPAWVTGRSPRQFPLLVKRTHTGEKADVCERHDRAFSNFSSLSA